MCPLWLSKDQMRCRILNLVSPHSAGRPVTIAMSGDNQDEMWTKCGWELLQYYCHLKYLNQSKCLQNVGVLKIFCRQQ